MSSSRLEAFSDGVLAIIITIMVLELHAPDSRGLQSLRPLFPVFVSYVLSFIYIGVYWNNHHHLFQAVERVTGGALWANLHLLFWISLIPFATAWMGQTEFAAAPVALYGAVLLGAACAYFILTRALLRSKAGGERLAAAIGNDRKGKVSVALYAAAVPLAFVVPLASGGIYLAVVLIWLAPDRRIERLFGLDEAEGTADGS